MQPNPNSNKTTPHTQPGWSTRCTIQLNQHQITISEPVLVKRSRWFCWFPSLVRQPDGTLWAIMNAYADVHVSDSFCYLSRSQDEGLTWDEPRVIGDAGLSHLILQDGSALILPYYLRPRANNTIGAPCNILSSQGELSVVASGVNVSNWPRRLKSISPDLATAGFVFNGQVVKDRSGNYLATLYGTFEGDHRYSLVLAESTDGFTWRIRSIIAGVDCQLDGNEGPCESAICRLEDGRLMSIFRLASFVPYGLSWSEDEGHSWTTPIKMPAGSVEPSLQVLADGIIALSGGRPGISVWLSKDASGLSWQEIDIVTIHNACQPLDQINPDSTQAWKPRDEMIRQDLSGFTSSYTELIRLDDCHMLLIYDRVGLGWNAIPDNSSETNSVWVVRISVE